MGGEAAHSAHPMCDSGAYCILLNVHCSKMPISRVLVAVLFRPMYTQQRYKNP